MIHFEGCRRRILKADLKKAKARHFDAWASVVLFGSPGRTRTADRVVNSHLLYRLSYRGIGALSKRQI